MRGAVLLLTWVALCMPASAAKAPNDRWAWDQWQRLPVQAGGRQKPLDTLARETLQIISNRQSFRDPKTRKTLDPVAWYLTMLFDWQGWSQMADLPLATQGDPTAAYFFMHTADKWDRAPLFRVDRLALREALGIPTGRMDVSALELSRTSIRDPRSGKRIPFLVWTDQRSLNDKESPLTRFEDDALRLAGQLRLYQAHRMGLGMRVLPMTDSALQEWVSMSRLWNTHYDDGTDPTGALRRAQESFQEIRMAFVNSSPERFNRSAAKFIAVVTKSGPELGSYPDRARIDLELAYNQWTPIRFAWILTLSALVLVYLSTGTQRRVFYSLGIFAFSAGLVATLLELLLRVFISGRAPVTNMYESVIFMALGTGLLGLILEFKWRRSFIVGASAAISTVALILADRCPGVLDQSIRPLQPALRSDFWLVVHVLTVTLSYSAFALALGIGNITLGYYIFRSDNRHSIETFTALNCRCLRIGVLLIAVGTVTGGIWADYCWGRFWGWDPKEVWALITLLGYVAVLHARYVHWVGHFGLAAMSVICFSLVVIAWYGVNFVLSSGLHSYGQGHGGSGYVVGFLFAQFLYVAIAAARSTVNRMERL